MYAVAKAFKTVNRRFNVDDPVVPVDIVSENPLSFFDLKERGFIKSRRADYDAMSKSDLEALAAERGVDISGAKTKAEIGAELDRAEKVEEAVATDSLDALLKADLERIAVDRGIDITEAKTKADLIALLRAHPEVPVVSEPEA